MKQGYLSEEIKEIAIAAGCIIRQEVHTDGFKGLANDGYTIIYQIRDSYGRTGASPVEHDVTELVLELFHQIKTRSGK